MDERAKQVFDIVCEMLDDVHFHYDKQDKDLIITSFAKGDTLPIPFMMRVAPQKELVSFHSVLPFDVDDNMQEDICIALNMINCNLSGGCFACFDGKISYKSAAIYRGMTVGKKLFEEWMMTSLAIINEYNGKLEKAVSEHMPLDDMRKHLV